MQLYLDTDLVKKIQRYCIESTAYSNYFFFKPCIGVVRQHKFKYGVTELSMSYTDNKRFFFKEK